MDATLKREFRNRIFRFFSRRVVYHSIFWAFVLLLLMALNTSNSSSGFKLLTEMVNLGFYALIVYFNLLYLIPNYLTEKQFVVYGFLLILSAILLTPIKLLVFYFLFSSDKLLQTAIITDQFYFFLSSFAIAGSSTVIKIIFDWSRQQREKQELQTKTMQTELRFLKSQINPHFLFNTLNNLYALTLKKDDRAPEIVIKLSEMMRYMLYECNERRVPLSKEVNYIKNYLELERLRQGDQVDVNLDMSGYIGEQRIAPFMFIPFLENSFKHGLSNHLGQGFVHAKLVVEDQKIHFVIENSKPEKLPLPERRRVGGIGLVNVRRRLNLQYPGRHELRITDSPNSFTVDLNIRLDQLTD